MRHTDDSRDPGWEAMRCKNHPTMRWTRKSREHMAGAISRNIQLGFDGDLANPDAEIHPWFTSEAQVRESIRSYNDWDERQGDKIDADAELARLKDSGYVFECACPYSDLEFMADVKERTA